MFKRALLALPLLIACSSGPDLPEGWEEAEPILEFTQSACDGDPTEEYTSEVDAQLGQGTLDVTWTNAVFRCEQQVEGFVRRNGVQNDILIQPVEIEPDSVARCDCLYTLDWGFNVSDDLQTVTLYKRTDEYGGPSSPNTIGTFNFQQAE